MTLRYLLGRVSHTTGVPAYLTKLKISLWRHINLNLLNPISCSSCSTLVHLHGSAFSAPNSQSQNATSCGGTCIYNGAQKDDWIISLAQFAVHQNNERENKNLQFVRVVGASHTMVSSILYHIPLEAADTKNKHKIFLVVVWMQLLKNFMELLVWKPVDDQLSAVGVKRGDLKLHETIMFYMNQVKQDHFRI